MCILYYEIKTYTFKFIEEKTVQVKANLKYHIVKYRKNSPLGLCFKAEFNRRNTI